MNNDRVAGFEHAIKDLDQDNEDLVQLFKRCVDQSKKFSAELQEASARHGLAVESQTSVTGAIHRAWIDFKALFSAQNRQEILAEAERGEDIIKDAYRDALVANYLTSDLLALVKTQAEGICAAHDTVKELRNQSS